MSRYTQFEEQASQKSSLVLEQTENEQNLVCVRNLLSKPIPLMNKLQYKVYEAKNYYPVLMSKLPSMLSNHEYHIDNNNMLMIDQTMATHDRFKREMFKCINIGKQQKESIPLLTLKEFYCNKNPIYEKLVNNQKSNYFATYVLNMASLSKEEIIKSKRSSFVIRNLKTPLLTQRSNTQRMSLGCRPKIDFNSNFESGNLFKVYQKQYNEYDLILQNDINTKGNNQWFFFSVKNVPKGMTVKFNIVNLSKKHSLFEYGMKPAVFSMMKFQKRKIGWVRDGSKISYYENPLICKESSSQPYYCLSFEYRFTYDGDIVYFGYSIPYTFSNLSSYLLDKISTKRNQSLIKIKSLAQTIGGNEVNIFQITDLESRFDKKSIWILCRQHPGEVTSSFMLEGIIDFLLSESVESEFLLKHFVFKIVPMVNIDGVVHGNTRSELVGCDSNRVWQDPHKIYNPVIYSLKKRICNDNVQMILDLHSHSRKLGTFFYTNNLSENRNLTKVFPMMVCKEDERFDYRSNRYKGGSNKTARKVLFDILNIPFIYTVQSSFYGYQKQGDFKINQYQPQDYRQMGSIILKTFAKLSQKILKSQIYDQRLLLCNQQQLNQDNNIWDKMNEADEIQSVGSDENPQQDQFSKRQLDLILPSIKKKVTKKKTNKKKVSQKTKVAKRSQPLKVEQLQPKLKKIDKDSHYKKYFSGKWQSSNQQNLNQLVGVVFKQKIQQRSYGCQVDIPENRILKKSSTNNIQTQRIHYESLLDKKGLFVIGQKMDQFVVNGNSVGVQAVPAKKVFINRNQLATSTGKRGLSSKTKGATLMLHNQNNFLNRGDYIHGIKTFYRK